MPLPGPKVYDNRLNLIDLCVFLTTLLLACRIKCEPKIYCSADFIAHQIQKALCLTMSLLLTWYAV